MSANSELETTSDEAVALSLRDAHGRFQAGHSGNKGGRPSNAGRVRALARELTDDAMAVLQDLLGSQDERTRLAAANSILDRGWGRPSSAEVVAREGEESGESLNGYSTEELLQMATAKLAASGSSIPKKSIK
jgi:hypothetical protein